jgi:hypothetical protein
MDTGQLYFRPLSLLAGAKIIQSATDSGVPQAASKTGDAGPVESSGGKNDVFSVTYPQVICSCDKGSFS